MPRERVRSETNYGERSEDGQRARLAVYRPRLAGNLSSHDLRASAYLGNQNELGVCVRRVCMRLARRMVLVEVGRGFHPSDSAQVNASRPVDQSASQVWTLQGRAAGTL